MKLSTQYLLRAWNDKAPDWDKRLEKFSQTLIEQIDTLSSIANEFSNFAQMPPADIERVDLVSVCEAAVDLYKTSAPAKIIFNKRVDVAYINADKDHLLRIFNNLIKNGLQAIPDGREGIINISLSKSNSDFLITIADNGIGIDDEIKEKIFRPNFTTKTKGMGLGLAMVKNMVEMVNGKIWFETVKDVGTTFYISYRNADA